MKRGWRNAAVAIGAAAGFQVAAAQAPLMVCMERDNPPLSHVAGGQPRGFDTLLARAVADELKRPLQIVLFESEYEKETALTHEVNALLSSGVCDMASGFPLLAADVGAPSRPSARTPDYPGAKRRRERPFVPLGTLLASRPYQAMAMAVVSRDPQLAVASLADLKGAAKLGVVTGTMAGSALAMYRNGLLRSQLVTLSQRDDLFAALEAGRFDAALVALNRFDGHRLAHPDTPIRRSGAYLHGLRINVGMVSLEAKRELLDAANRVIEGAIASGEIERWAASSGTTWVRPQPPDLSPGFSPASLASD